MLRFQDGLYGLFFKMVCMAFFVSFVELCCGMECPSYGKFMNFCRSMGSPVLVDFMDCCPAVVVVLLLVLVSTRGATVAQKPGALVGWSGSRHVPARGRSPFRRRGFPNRVTLDTKHSRPERDNQDGNCSLFCALLSRNRPD